MGRRLGLGGFTVWQWRPYISSSASVQTKLSGYGASPGIAPFWHRSRPYKARYRVRMPGIELSLGSDGLRYCRVSSVFTAKSCFSPSAPSNTLTGSSVVDHDSSVTFLHRVDALEVFYCSVERGARLIRAEL